MVSFMLTIGIIFGLLTPVFAQEASLCHRPGELYLARHAKKVGNDGEGLTAMGWFQAGKLMEYFFKKGITHIYTSEILRAKQTARPLSERISVEPEIILRTKPSEQVDQLCEHAPSDRVLVIGHSNKLPQILTAFRRKLWMRMGEFPESKIRYCHIYQVNLETGEVLKNEYFQGQGDECTG